ncbi:MAG: hemerythrin domain-containing protein [Chromatiales bacterium]|jgi:hemerythrin-like domain-containing protein
MHRILQHLHRDHLRLAQLLDLMEHQLDLFHAGDEPELDLLIDMLDYLENYADCVHHRAEDLIFDAFDAEHPGHRAVIEELEAQHTRLSEMTRTFRHALEGIVQGSVQRRDEVERLGREYLDLQRRHMEAEERDILPVLEESVTDELLDSLESQLPSPDDPLFDDRVKDHYRMLYRYLAKSGGGSQG